MTMTKLTIRSRQSTVLPEYVDDHIRVQGEVPWYLEGSADLIEQAADALAGVCERITSQVLLVTFGNAVGRFEVPGLGSLEVVCGKWESSHFDRMLVDLCLWAAALPFSTEGGAIGAERRAVAELNVLYHAFVYLRSIVSDHVPRERRLLDALHLVIQNPDRQLERIRREVPLDTVRQVDPSLLLDLVAGRYPLLRVEAAVQPRLPLARHLRGHVPA
jgi:hypothetical protein